jgi:hypothetical protein
MKQVQNNKSFRLHKMRERHPTQCFGSISAWIRIILVNWIRIQIQIRINICIKIYKLDQEPDPDPHQFAHVKPKYIEYAPI